MAGEEERRILYTIGLFTRNLGAHNTRCVFGGSEYCMALRWRHSHTHPLVIACALLRSCVIMRGWAAMKGKVLSERRFSSTPHWVIDASDRGGIRR